ncbi:unnamed protein product, partial [Prorocentrum cordatum]
MLVERTMEGTEAQKILASATGATSEELAEFAEQHLRKPWLDSPWLGVEMPLGVLHLANGAPDIPKKLKFLQRLTSSIEPEPTGILVFCNNVERVRKVLQELRRMGIPSQALTGNRSAAERVDAIKNLGKGVIEVIVCTDVASRGLDFKELSHVVNFEMPPDAHAYAHRAGRVGRAGKSGIVISLGGGGSENNRLTNYANELGITVSRGRARGGRAGSPGPPPPRPPPGMRGARVQRGLRPAAGVRPAGGARAAVEPPVVGWATPPPKAGHRSEE